MPFFIQLEDAAKALNVPSDDLTVFEKRGWISFTHFPGTSVTYLRGHQQYRAKFILALRDRMHLSAAQITKVLENQKPPYSMAEVAEVLSQSERAT